MSERDIYPFTKDYFKKKKISRNSITKISIEANQCSSIPRKKLFFQNVIPNSKQPRIWERLVYKLQKN